MKIVRYFFVGGVAAVIDIGLFGVGVKVLNLPWFPVAVASFVIATAANYLLSIRHVFQSGARFDRSMEILMTFLVSGVGLLVNQTVLWFLIESVALDVLFSKLTATSVVFFWNYVARNKFVFRETLHKS